MSYCMSHYYAYFDVINTSVTCFSMISGSLSQDKWVPVNGKWVPVNRKWVPVTVISGSLSR